MAWNWGVGGRGSREQGGWGEKKLRCVEKKTRRPQMGVVDGGGCGGFEKKNFDVMRGNIVEEETRVRDCSSSST